jgi:hypothetical protein
MFEITNSKQTKQYIINILKSYWQTKFNYHTLANLTLSDGALIVISLPLLDIKWLRNIIYLAIK